MPQRPPGFTLLEMAIVLTIVGLVAAMGTNMGISSVKLVSTNNKLSAIETALMAYRTKNNRLPCPTDATITVGSAGYGYETGTAGKCGGSATSNIQPSPSSNTHMAGTGTVVEGAVPVKTLGLPDEYQFDAWGRKFAYAVWTPSTATGAFNDYGTSSSCGAITAKNVGQGNRDTEAVYTLLSYGPDGHRRLAGRRRLADADSLCAAMTINCKLCA